MDVHKNARLTPAGREIMVRRVVEGGQAPQALSAAVGVCPRTVRKWVTRFRAEGLAGQRGMRKNVSIIPLPFTSSRSRASNRNLSPSRQRVASEI